MLVSDYALTRKRADDWRGAQRALSAVPDDTTFLPVRVDGDVPAAEVDRTVAYLEGREDSRRAIEESGLSVRDFVLTALALERAERARSSPGGLSVRAEDLALASEYEADLAKARRSSGLHIVDYDDGSDRFDGDGREAGRRGHAHGKGKGKGKWKGNGKGGGKGKG